MTAVRVFVIRHALAPRRRLIARFETLRESQTASGRGAQVGLSVLPIAFVSVPANKLPTLSRGRLWERNYGVPAGWNLFCAWAAEMAAPFGAVKSDAPALGRRLTQLRTHSEASDHTGRVG